MAKERTTEEKLIYWHNMSCKHEQQNRKLMKNIKKILKDFAQKIEGLLNENKTVD